MVTAVAAAQALVGFAFAAAGGDAGLQACEGGCAYAPVNAVDRNSDPHALLSSHSKRSQRRRSAMSITARISKRRVPWRRRICGSTPVR